MKRIILGFAAVVLFAGMFGGCSSQAKYKSIDPAKAAFVKESITERDYRIDIDWVVPARGRSFAPTSAYSLEVKQDSVLSYLPYFGRAYSVPYGGGEGLNFEGVTQDYVSAAGKRDATEISFSVRTREDNYKFRITVYPNGSADILVQPNNKQSISFQGTLAENPGKK